VVRRFVGGAVGAALIASAQQQLNHVATLGIAGYHQGRHPTVIRLPYVGAPIQQQLRHIAVPVLTRQQQGRPSIFICMPHDGASIKQQLCHIAVPVQTGHHKGNHSIVPCPFDGCACSKKNVRSLFVAHL
jgi:hypothetical protein